MAAISSTSCVFSSAFKTRANKKLPTASWHAFVCKYKVKCSSSRQHSGLSQQSLPFIDSGLHGMEIGRSNIRRSILEEDSSIEGQLQPLTESECAAPSTRRTIARLLNISTKWIIVVGVISTLVWRHNSPEVVWALTGGTINGLTTKPLKRLFNQPRPASAVGLKSDGGMPSSHAQNLGYVTASSLCVLFGWNGVNAFSLGIASAIITWAACMAWLRVLEGFHTYSQIIVGSLIGLIVATSWFWLWNSMMLNILTSTWKHFLFIIFQVVFIVSGLIALILDFT